MKNDEAVEKLARQVHWLKVYCMAITAALLVLLLSAAAERTQPGELTIERLNIVDASGKRRVVISNAEGFPPVLLAGKTYQRAINLAYRPAEPRRNRGTGAGGSARSAAPAGAGGAGWRAAHRDAGCSGSDREAGELV